MNFSVIAVVVVCCSLASEPLTTDDVAAASKTLAVELTESEQKQALRSLQQIRSLLADLRKEDIPNSLSPAVLFDPRPPGFIMPLEESSFTWEPPVLEAPKDRQELAFYTVAQLASLLRTRKVSSEELTRFYLERLQKYGPALHCVVTLMPERALAAARRADLELQAGRWRGPLHGVPCGVKDLLDVAGFPSTWGVSLYTNRVAAADSAVVRKLDDAGAVILAKLSLGELAMGDRWYGGLTRNPWRPESGSSGSSAGSASAVAAGLLPFAIGSETHGSIVSPATTCGVTGLRPTYGRVSRTGAMTLSYSMDKIGPLARSAEDCALIFNSIRGADGTDRSVVEAPFVYPGKALQELRIGLVTGDANAQPTNETDRAALGVLRELGVDLKPVHLPGISRRLFSFLIAVEAAAAFDELTRTSQDDQLVQQHDWSWPNAFRAARFVSAVDYLQVQRLRSRLMEEMHALFQKVDVLVAPAARWNSDLLLFSNLTGHPCVVVPTGKRPTEQPASLIFVAGLYREGDALAAAEAFQKATEWHRQKPDLSQLEAVPE